MLQRALGGCAARSYSTAPLATGYHLLAPKKSPAPVLATAKTTQLRSMLQNGSLEFAMEAHNGLSAKIVEECGFKVSTVTTARSAVPPLRCALSIYFSLLLFLSVQRGPIEREATQCRQLIHRSLRLAFSATLLCPLPQRRSGRRGTRSRPRSGSGTTPKLRGPRSLRCGCPRAHPRPTAPCTVTPPDARPTTCSARPQQHPPCQAMTACTLANPRECAPAS